MSRNRFQLCMTFDNKCCFSSSPVESVLSWPKWRVEGAFLGLPPLIVISIIRYGRRTALRARCISAPLPQVFNVLRSPEQVECARRAFSSLSLSLCLSGYKWGKWTLHALNAPGYCKNNSSPLLPLGPDLFYVIARRKVWRGRPLYMP